jgi:hypothetical protein
MTSSTTNQPAMTGLSSLLVSCLMAVGTVAVLVVA